MRQFLSGLVCGLAFFIGAGAQAADTDGDGFSDDLEIALGTSPDSNTSVPQLSGPDVPFARLAANIQLNFKAGTGVLRMGGRIPLPQSVDFQSKAVVLDVGGAVRRFDTDRDSLAVRMEDVFAAIPGAEGDGRFALAFNVKPDAFADDGFDNTESKNKVVSVPVALYLNNRRFTVTLSGVYNAKPNKAGDLVANAILTSEPIDTTKPPPVPQPETTLFAVNPNPAMPNQPVTFSAAAALKDTEGILGSILLFGDGTAAVRSAGFIFANGATQTHTYMMERGYTARLIVIGPNGLRQTRLFIAVGQKTALNGFSGLGSTLSQNGANIQLAINTENVENNFKTLTTFTDTFSRDFVTAGVVSKSVKSRETVEGELVGRSTPAAGITVAESVVVDEGGNEQASVSKQVVTSDLDTGASDALPAPVSTEIVVSKMSGKFLFNKATPDQVTLKGEIALPTGFQPAKAGGNSFVVGIGNVVDQVIVDSKGKPLDPKNGDLGRIKKCKITFPRLAKGTTATVGGEVAKINVTFSLADMDVVGFDSEGITASLRSDEENQSDVERYIQVGMVLDGVAFESVITVEYKVSTSSGTGQFVGRAVK